MKPIRIPLVGSYINRNIGAALTDTTDQKFVNCYPEVVHNPITEKMTLYLNKRIGLLAAGGNISGVDGGGFGSCVWASNSAATSPSAVSMLGSNGTTMRVYNDSQSQLGGDIASTNECLFLSDTDVSGTGNLTGIFADSSTNALEAWYFPEGGAWTQITDTDFPPNLGTPELLTGYIEHKNGFMFVMTTNGKIWNSDVNSVSAWSPNSYISAQSIPDKGSGIARYKDFIVGFGAYSTEFFSFEGNPTNSPLSMVQNVTLRIGALPSAAGSATNKKILSVGDTVYWIGPDLTTRRVAMWRLKGFEAEKVSTPAIDKILNNSALVRGFVGSFTSHGMVHIMLDFFTNANIPCFCVDLNHWWLFTTGTNAVSGVLKSCCPSPTNSGNIMTTSLNPKLFIYSGTNATYQDNTTAFTMTVRTENLDFDIDLRKFMPSLRVIGDTQTAASLLGIAWSDDDFATTSTARNIDLSTTQKNLTRLGSFFRRSFTLTHAANTPCRLKALEFPGLKIGRT